MTYRELVRDYAASLRRDHATATFLGQGEGMVIGAVNGVVITEDTPLDPGQWQDGKPWHTPHSELEHERGNRDAKAIR